ncbi:hypothetical protein FAZ19_14900 [Sphingobacterium alkalisoli]|uniref:Uncharacterized protein n=1 Tax=Sphingobacterium alkalisoli TaxID=1874115 RepID=A0A4U0GZ60_9SPHI|nr:hypothetical protein [Sphingobacterium alkalisoli]TJY64483.1 hypothetical protein FAZ19_14900 [Sphingobacterium alkalisoli]GGH21480.1 hypothetical protein GCM10011418_27380 [Sphingobacterium alkalisoli]
MANGQNANVFIEAFEVENPALRNGKIYYFNSQNDTTYNFRFSLGRNIALQSQSLNVEAYAVFDFYGTEYNASELISLSSSNFSQENGLSTGFQFKTFTLQSNKKNGSLRFKYRFYINAPGYNDWSPWYYSDKIYQTEQYQPPVPVTTFVGPDQICDEGTYTITNPGVITLENATNIATLTNLGNNQYKVTRIGIGNVILKSVQNSLTVTKSIRVGPEDPRIFGPAGPLAYTGLYTFSVSPIAGATYNWTVVGAPPNSLHNTSGPTLNLRIGSGSGNRTVRVSVQASTECGLTGWVEKVIELQSGGVLPVEP